MMYNTIGRGIPVTEIAIPDSGQLSIDELLAAAGNSVVLIDKPALEKDLLRLVGVPHIITSVTYRPGVLDSNKVRGDYVSVEYIVAKQAQLDEAIKRGWIPPDNMDVIPHAEERGVYNNSGTGIRRQLTHILWSKGLLVLGGNNAPESMADFDQRFQDWTSFSQATEMNDSEGGKFPVPSFSRETDGRPLVIIPRHGLRASYMEEYDTNVFYLS